MLDDTLPENEVDSMWRKQLLDACIIKKTYTRNYMPTGTQQLVKTEHSSLLADNILMQKTESSHIE